MQTQAVEEDSRQCPKLLHELNPSDKVSDLNFPQLWDLWQPLSGVMGCCRIIQSGGV